MKVFVEFGKRGAGETHTIELEDAKLAQELAVKLAKTFGRTSFYPSDFLSSQTIPRQSWIGDEYYVGVGLVRGTASR